MIKIANLILLFSALVLYSCIHEHNDSSSNTKNYTPLPNNPSSDTDTYNSNTIIQKPSNQTLEDIWSEVEHIKS